MDTKNMIDSFSYYGNEYKNSEILLHTHWKGDNEKVKQRKVLVRM